MEAQSTAAAAERPVLWRPNPGPQTRFLATKAHEVLYGGAARGGKSSGVIVMPLRWVTNPHFSALILRRDTTQLGDLLRKAEKLYPAMGGRPKADGASVTWKFKSGAFVWFTHCQHEDDVARFDGWEFQLVEFDELTHFTELQYMRIRARITSPHPGLPRYTRSTTNPGGEGHAWVFKRFGPWLDPKYEIPGLPKGNGETPPAAPGQLLWFARRGGLECVVPPGEMGDPDALGKPVPAMSRTFIPARLEDNPRVAENDPTYISTLDQLDPVRRAQLREGNWLVKYSAGSLFRAGWWKFIDKPPAEVLCRWRAWDRAATAPHEGNLDPDWTRGVKMSRTLDGKFFVEDMRSERDGPHAVRNLMKNTAVTDGVDCNIALFRDPGSAGKDEEASSIELLAGFNVHSQAATGDKVSRARPFSAQVEPGNVYLVRGPWNEEFIRELEAFPTEGVHDDIVDASSNAFSRVAPVSDLEFFNQISTL